MRFGAASRAGMPPRNLILPALEKPVDEVPRTLQERAERLRDGKFLGVPIDGFERAAGSS